MLNTRDAIGNTDRGKVVVCAVNNGLAAERLQAGHVLRLEFIHGALDHLSQVYALALLGQDHDIAPVHVRVLRNDLPLS